MSYAPSPAGFWKRYVAYFIDFMLVTTVLHVVMTPLLFVGLDRATLEALAQPDVFADPASSPGQVLLAMQAWLLPLVPWLAWVTAATTLGYALLAGAYFIWMEASTRQATLGKQLMGLKVTALDGGPPGTGRVVGRFLAAALSWITLNLGHALAGWTRERRALHDFLAGTRVENADPAQPGMPAWGWAIVALNAIGLVGFALFTVSLVMFVWLQMQMRL